jgi:hypothetical protein
VVKDSAGQKLAYVYFEDGRTTAISVIAHRALCKAFAPATSMHAIRMPMAM